MAGGVRPPAAAAGLSSSNRKKPERTIRLAAVREEENLRVEGYVIKRLRLRSLPKLPPQGGYPFCVWTLILGYANGVRVAWIPLRPVRKQPHKRLRERRRDAMYMIMWAMHDLYGQSEARITGAISTAQEMDTTEKPKTPRIAKVVKEIETWQRRGNNSSVADKYYLSAEKVIK